MDTQDIPTLVLRTAGELSIAFSTGHVQTICLRGEVSDFVSFPSVQPYYTLAHPSTVFGTPVLIEYLLRSLSFSLSLVYEGVTLGTPKRTAAPEPPHVPSVSNMPSIVLRYGTFNGKVPNVYVDTGLNSYLVQGTLFVQAVLLKLNVFGITAVILSGDCLPAHASETLVIMRPRHPLVVLAPTPDEPFDRTSPLIRNECPTGHPPATAKTPYVMYHAGRFSGGVV